MKKAKVSFEDLSEDRRRFLLKSQIQVETRRLYDLMSTLREIEPMGFTCEMWDVQNQPIVISATLNESDRKELAP